jgi:hypothetical protein
LAAPVERGPKLRNKVCSRVVVGKFWDLHQPCVLVAIPLGQNAVRLSGPLAIPYHIIMIASPHLSWIFDHPVIELALYGTHVGRVHVDHIITIDDRLQVKPNP